MMKATVATFGKRLVSLGTVSVLLLLTGCVVFVSGVEDAFERTLPAETPLELEVVASSGSIHIDQSSDGQVHIRGSVRVVADTTLEAQSLAARVVGDPPIDVVAGTITIGDLDKYRLGIGQDLTVSYRVTVPFETAVTTRSSSGRQRIYGVRGPVSASASSGAIEIGSISESVSATVSSGRISVSDVQGDVKAISSSGRVSVNGAAGDIEVETSSGRVDLAPALAENPQWQVQTTSGLVTVELPEGSGCQVEFTTHSGRIDLGGFSFNGSIDANRVSGLVGSSAGGELRVATTSGSIRLLRG